jgi:hypothetical protein
MRILYIAGFKLSVVKYAKSHFGPPPAEKNMLMEKARGIITELREEKHDFHTYTVLQNNLTQNQM